MGQKTMAVSGALKLSATGVSFTCHCGHVHENGPASRDCRKWFCPACRRTFSFPSTPFSPVHLLVLIYWFLMLCHIRTLVRKDPRLRMIPKPTLSDAYAGISTEAFLTVVALDFILVVFVALVQSLLMSLR
jgi:hypothetical protein